MGVRELYFDLVTFPWLSSSCSHLRSRVAFVLWRGGKIHANVRVFDQQ